MSKIRKITPKQKKFADTLLETGIKVKSALEAYDTKDYNTAHVIAHENLQKPTVIKYLEDNASNAAARVVELSQQDENLNVALGASKDILDRAGYKPVDKSLNVNLDIETSAEEDPRMEEFRKQTIEKLRQIHES